jgi:hypothetical protein
MCHSLHLTKCSPAKPQHVHCLTTAKTADARCIETGCTAARHDRRCMVTSDACLQCPIGPDYAIRCSCCSQTVPASYVRPTSQHSSRVQYSRCAVVCGLHLHALSQRQPPHLAKNSTETQRQRTQHTTHRCAQLMIRTSPPALLSGRNASSRYPPSLPDSIRTT